jgi:hypothetical protein
MILKEKKLLKSLWTFQTDRRKKLYNAKLVKFNYYSDPKPWMLNSKGVITISGSTAFEARMLSRLASVFGHVCFNVIDGIDIVNSIRDLKNIFTGVSLDIKKLITLSLRCIAGKESEDGELGFMVNKLTKFYNESYDLQRKLK